MAISSQTSFKEFTGNGSTSTPYALTDLRFDDNSWITVKKVHRITGVATPLTSGADFTITGDGAASAASVVTVGGAISSEYLLRVDRSTPLVQSLALTANGAIPSTALEQTLDRQTMAEIDTRRAAGANADLAALIPNTLAAAEAAAEAAEAAEESAAEVEAAARFTIERGGAVIGTKPPAVARVVFVCDDGALTDYTVLRPIFANDTSALTLLGLTPKTYAPCTGTLALVSANIGIGGQMTVGHIQQMVSEGWEAASHSRTHPHIPDLTTAQQEDQILGSKADLEALGIPVLNFVWPYGDNAAESRAIAARGYRSAVAVIPDGVHRNVGPVSQFALGRYGMEGDTGWTIGDINTVAGTDGTAFSTLQDRKNLVAAASAEGGMLIFMVHSGPLQTSGRAQMLIELLEYIQGLPEYGDTLAITTLDEALDTHGNKFIAGDFLGVPRDGIPAVARSPYLVVGANGVTRSYTGQELWLYDDANGRSAISPITAFARGHITACIILPTNTAGLPTLAGGQGILTTYRLHESTYDDCQEFRPWNSHTVYRRKPNGASWNPWIVVADSSYTTGSNMRQWDRNAGTVLTYEFQQGNPAVTRSSMTAGLGFAYDLVFSAGFPFQKVMGLGYGNRGGVTVGAGLLAGAAISPTDGMAVQSDILITTATKGLVLRSPDGHYWRGTISNLGSVTWADLGTSAPT